MFILSALFCTQWLNLYSEPYNPTINDMLLVIWFMTAVALFALVGILGIADIRSTLKYQFRKLAEEKAEIKQDIANVSREMQLIRKIEAFLQSTGIAYQTEVRIKPEQMTRVDIVIPSSQNPKFLIEVKASPNFDSIRYSAMKYAPFAKEFNAKTILIANFVGKGQLDRAKAYWDVVIDINNLSQLKDVVQLKS